jgi:hypothetical protein
LKESQLVSNLLLRGFIGRVRGLGLQYWSPLENRTHGSDYVYEWWHERRKLTLYRGDEGVTYIKVWGAGEMEDGVCKEVAELVKLWNWLLGL